jgi:chemotaxis protein histidine kinase CheA
MSDPNGHATRYLLVEVTQQLFAIPIADVAMIRRAAEVVFPAHEIPSGAPESLPLASLGTVFGQTPPVDTPSYIVVLTASEETCAVQVDRIFAIQGVLPESCSPLPGLLAGVRFAFGAVAHVGDNLVLILNSAWLVRQICGSANPATTGGPHAG